MKRETDYRFRLVVTNWGCFGFVARGDALAATFLPDSAAALCKAIQSRFAGTREDERLMPGFVKQVRAYFAGRAVRFDVEVDFDGVPAFRRAVYEHCLRIGHGKTATYQDLARAVGNPNAVRAVGGAMANNRWPLVIPCHRVLRADGSLGGFSSRDGVKMKERLLRHEGVTRSHGEFGIANGERRERGRRQLVGIG
jgi:methylated-DNA-[protein]-cysteine S-methyltransferase